MKLWELVSVMRGEKNVLVSVLDDPKWVTYRKWYDRFGDHVKAQDRTILDAEIPDELCQAAFARSVVKYYIEGLWLRKAVPGQTLPENSQGLSALEAFRRAGGSALEEVHEFGSCRIST